MLQPAVVNVQGMPEILVIIVVDIKMPDVFFSDLLGGVTEQLPDGGCGPKHISIDVRLVYGVLHTVEYGTQALLRGAYAFLCELAFLDVFLQFLIGFLRIAFCLFRRLPGDDQLADELGIMRAETERLRQNVRRSCLPPKSIGKVEKKAFGVKVNIRRSCACPGPFGIHRGIPQPRPSDLFKKVAHYLR